MANLKDGSGAGGWGDRPRRPSRFSGNAGALHARELREPGVYVLEADAPALVLGSGQAATVADHAACDAAGVAVVRRRSGGGVVLVGPGECVWVDVVLGSDDARWTDDVSSSAWWLGEAWVAALSAVGVEGAVVYRDSMCINEWGRLVCFAGLAGGEVTMGDGGPKAVGISQRRGRGFARFQCAVPMRWDADQLVSLLSWPSDDERSAARDALSLPSVVAPVTPDVGAGLVEALLAVL